MGKGGKGQEEEGKERERGTEEGKKGGKTDGGKRI